eukprot:183014_1
MRECKQILILVLLELGFLAANCDLQINEIKPVEVVIHDGTSSIPGDKYWDKEGASSALEPHLHSMTAADGTRFTCRLPVRTVDEESKSSVNNSLTVEQEFLGFVGSATLLEDSECYSSTVQKLPYESMANLTRATTFTLCMKSKVHQVDKDRNESNTYMYIPDSEEVVDVVKHMDISHYKTGIKPGTKGLLQRYEGGVISYMVCNTADKRTWLRGLPFLPHALILETPLVCGKTVQDIITAAYKFEVEKLANTCLTFYTDSTWSFVLCIMQSVVQKSNKSSMRKGLRKHALGTWDGKDLSSPTSASGKQAWVQHYINGSPCNHEHATKYRVTSVMYSCNTYWGPITKVKRALHIFILFSSFVDRGMLSCDCFGQASYVGPTAIPVHVDEPHICSYVFMVVLP